MSNCYHNLCAEFLNCSATCSNELHGRTPYRKHCSPPLSLLSIPLSLLLPPSHHSGSLLTEISVPSRLMFVACGMVYSYRQFWNIFQLLHLLLTSTSLQLPIPPPLATPSIFHDPLPSLPLPSHFHFPSHSSCPLPYSSHSIPFNRWFPTPPPTPSPLMSSPLIQPSPLVYHIFPPSFPSPSHFASTSHSPPLNKSVKYAKKSPTHLLLGLHNWGTYSTVWNLAHCVTPSHCLRLASDAAEKCWLAISSTIFLL